MGRLEDESLVLKVEEMWKECISEQDLQDLHKKYGGILSVKLGPHKWYNPLQKFRGLDPKKRDKALHDEALRLLSERKEELKY